VLRSARLQTIVWTARIAEASRFYGDVLGLPLRTRSHGALVYDVAGGELRVSPVPATRPTEHTVLGFAVTDLRTLMRGLSELGIRWQRFAHLAQDAEGVLQLPDGTRVAWFRDPDGNLLSIVEYPHAGESREYLPASG
jgi:catechol 2,3-dioxygenase-like lactoylglutathione lyase family enzyme